MEEIFIYDEIGPDWAGMVAAKPIRSKLELLKGTPVALRVNSPGGSVWEALGIYNAIAEHGDVTAYIDGLAASAGSYVTLAAKKTIIAENALYMLHPVMSIAWGNVEEIRKVLAMMETADGNGRKAYQAKSAEYAEKIGQMYDAETWLSAEDAVKYGFAAEIGQRFIGEVSKVAENRYKNAPSNLVARDPNELTANRAALRETVSNWKRKIFHASAKSRIQQLAKI